MMPPPDGEHRPLPPRFERPGPLAFTLGVAALAVLVYAITSSGISLDKLARGVPSLSRMFAQMFPPDFSRLEPISASLLETFTMALAGATVGVILAFPLAALAAANLTPHRLVGAAVRVIISFFRTVPDLVWALVFVIAVGLGPAAGTLAIVVDTIGFAGRFFAEAMEETDPGPAEALSAIGAGHTGTLFAAVVPSVLPAMIATSLFCLEKATRSSVVLGLVGAGGIGIELKVAMDLFDYGTAATIILLIFVLVVAVEQASSFLRSRIL